LTAMCPVGGLPERTKRMLARYVADMNSVLAEISRVLRQNGEAVVVVGDSTIRGMFIRNSQAIVSIARANGLTLRSTHRRPLLENRRYLPPPGRAMSGKSLRSRMREEVILSFVKSRIAKSERGARKGPHFDAI
jgi:ubiquinone/menaquinone biosynthesis C-methylase UbiE